MSKPKAGNELGEKSFIKGLSFIASSSGDANSSIVDVKNGRILRIRRCILIGNMTSRSLIPERWRREVFLLSL